jgi:hypothetical protein
MRETISAEPLVLDPQGWGAVRTWPILTRPGKPIEILPNGPSRFANSSSAATTPAGLAGLGVTTRSGPDVISPLAFSTPALRWLPPISIATVDVSRPGSDLSRLTPKSLSLSASWHRAVTSPWRRPGSQPVETAVSADALDHACIPAQHLEFRLLALTPEPDIVPMLPET